MTFYLALTGVLALLAVIIRPNPRTGGRKVYALAGFGTLAGVAAVRAPSVGADTQQYYRYFAVIGQTQWRDREILRYEPGFFLLNKVLYAISIHPQILVACTSIFVMAAVARFTWRYSPNIVLSVMLFVFLQGYATTMTAMRQSIATAIVLLVVPQLSQRRYLRFALGVLVAIQFHASAVALLVLIPLSRLPFRLRYLSIYIFATPVLALAAATILNLSASTNDRYAGYATNVAGSGGKLGVLLTLLLYVLLLASLTFSALRGPAALNERTSTQALLYYASWLIIPALGLAYGSNAYLRLTCYFVPFVAVALPVALRQIADPSLRRLMTYAAVVTALSYMLAISLLRPEWYSVIPYATFE
jgi:hypothetical protein